MPTENETRSDPHALVSSSTVSNTKWSACVGRVGAGTLHKCIPCAFVCGRPVQPVQPPPSPFTPALRRGIVDLGRLDESARGRPHASMAVIAWRQRPVVPAVPAEPFKKFA